jgi:hypothetical protein
VYIEGIYVPLRTVSASNQDVSILYATTHLKCKSLHCWFDKTKLPLLAESNNDDRRLPSSGVNNGVKFMV